MTRPGDVVGLPKLVLRYPTEPRAIAALLPPGLEPCGDPVVQINVYCVPVHGEPEHGISTKVPARYDGVDGNYCLGIGIDQESAIFVSRETNGQPKFPARSGTSGWASRSAPAPPTRAPPSSSTRGPRPVSPNPTGPRPPTTSGGSRPAGRSAVRTATTWRRRSSG